MKYKSKDMIHNFIKIIFSIVLCVWSNSICAQTPKLNFILESDETGLTRTYVARNSIIFKSGFSYNAINTNSFLAKIDTTLTFKITSIPNPVPGDTTNSSVDKIYTPGNTFSSDNTDALSGMSSVLPVSGVNGNFVCLIYPTLWLKTVPVTNNLNGGYKWKDITNNQTPVLKYSINGAGQGNEYLITREKIQTYNFNPAIDLSYENISKEILINNSNLAQTTIIGVWGAKEDFNLNKFIFGIDGRPKESVLFTKNCVAQADGADKVDLNFGSSTSKSLLYESNSIEGSDINRFHEKSLRVGTYFKANNLNTSIWGEQQKAVISLGYKFEATNVNNTSTFNSKWLNLSEFKGFTPEMLIFNGQLSPIDCRKFETYLAIKYGISLDASYVSAKGSILWDYNLNLAYKNRITGYGREDEFGLLQKMSTTSYEEAPFYTDQKLFDSYYSNDSYQKSSPNRLLVMGCQESNTLDNGKFILFGDNNGSIACADSIVDSASGTMSRKWRICTNMEPSTDEKKTLTWSKVNVNITEKNKFISDIVKIGSLSNAFMVTSKSLKGKDGYFAWTVEQEYGPLYVKFGRNSAALSPNSNDYGYKIAEDGQVYSIQKGIINVNSLFTVEKGQRIEVEKNGRIFFLRINGVRYKNTEFIVDSSHIDLPYYGAIYFYGNLSKIQLTNFRHGGFVDTGHKVELSYLPQKASDFANNLNGKTSLIIDRSGSGSFTGETETYFCDEIDEKRSKIIFNNIFWDTDGNGVDVFTFGYNNSALLRSKKMDNSEEEFETEENAIKDDVQIFYKSMNDLSTVTVRVQMDEPSEATITLYDLLGKRILRRVLSDLSNVQLADICLPKTGLYIIKVTTKNLNYSQEVISRK